MLYLLLAGIATPLVVSVHSVVSFDFATSVVPGWHSTIFPPYFVVGAIFSGFGMVMTLMLVARKTMHFEAYITQRHIDAMCKVLIFTGSIVGLAYATEAFMAWYSGNPYEKHMYMNRAFGAQAWAFWTTVACNVVIPQFLYSARVRKNLLVVFVISILVNLGMWLERWVIITVSLEQDFLPSSWTTYSPTLIELATLVGTFGIFFSLFLLFCRFFPFMAISELKGVKAKERKEAA